VPPRGSPNQALAIAIRSRREAQATSQEEAAHRARLTTGTFGLIERGKTNPTWTTVQQIAAALELTVADLATLVEEIERREQP
jgi:DNA-binding XRE family transcriptional regulator